MPRKIIICFDGTGNEAIDAVQKEKLFGVEDDSISNVLKLHFLFGGTLKKGVMTNKISASDQLSLYYSGVGTHGNGIQRIFNQAFAPPSLDVDKIKDMAFADLKEFYTTGDELFIFGFSRGAAIARQFAVLLDQNPNFKIDSIRFLGLFDTVASIGIPELNSETKPEKTVIFEDCHVCRLVKKAVHFLSIDEKRKAFQPTLMNYETPEPGKEPRIEEIWFSGAHSDIGGGYRHDGLSDVTLECMLDKIKENKLRLRVLHAGTLDYDTLVPKQEKNVKIEYADMHSQPNPLGLSHEQDRFILISLFTLCDRDVRVDINDAKSDIVPTLHPAVMERLQKVRAYKPKSMAGLMHKLLGSDEVFKGFSEHKASTESLPEPLEQGHSIKVRVYANRLFNSSSILLEEGGAYTLHVNGEEQWYDSTISCNYKGWTVNDQDLKEKFGFLQKFFIKAKRSKRIVPDAKWFELCASIGSQNNPAFSLKKYIEGSKTFTPDTTGEFLPFANDLKSMYHNNMGFIDVTVTRN